jgi:type IV pilus assembly protein PilB
MQMNDKAVGQLSGLAGRLVAEGLISAQAAVDAQKQSFEEKVPLVQFLVERLNVDDKRLAEVASHEFGIPLFDIHAFNRSNFPAGLVEAQLIIKHHALPLYKRGTRLFIAISDPTNLQALDEIKG